MGDAQANAASDTGLIDRLRRGDPAAATALMQRHNRALWRIARGILKDEVEAEDAVQDTYVRALTHIEGFRGGSSLATWLSRIAVNEALRRLGQRKPSVGLDDVADRLIAEGPSAFRPADAPDPEREAARRELRRLVEIAIDELAAPYRAVFIMRAVEQMSIEETARSLGIPSETVKTRLHRANRCLREKLGGEIAAAIEGIFPFAGARCHRLQQAVLRRLAEPNTERGPPSG